MDSNNMEQKEKIVFPTMTEEERRYRKYFLQRKEPKDQLNMNMDFLFFLDFIWIFLNLRLLVLSN